MVATRRLKELIDANLPRLLLPADPVTVALSGGADSAALAILCLKSGRDVDAVHVDHGLAGSPMMSSAAEGIAADLGIDLAVVRVAVPGGPSPEERAREARYAALLAHPNAVLTAHTKDDNAETMLINLVRGTGAAGLTGIPYHRPPNVYRPMLDVSRSDAREIAALSGAHFVDDPMNLDPGLGRNRIRLRIVPLLRELNPQVSDALARAAQALARDGALLDTLTPGVEGDGVPIGLLATLPRPLADRLLMRLLHVSGVGPTADRVERAWEVVRGGADSHDLAGGKRVVRHGAMLRVE